MELPDFIQLGGETPPLRFLIIGGWAVGAHGNPRATFDVDFMIRRKDRDAWFQRTLARGLKLFRESATFAQFTQQEGDGFDLMFASDETFARIWDASEERTFGEAKARVPCLDHLLALKLHASGKRWRIALPRTQMMWKSCFGGIRLILPIHTTRPFF